jgi:nucleoside-diphosphate-sugar epimerase
LTRDHNVPATPGEVFRQPAVIFGGTGCIGTHTAQHFLARGLFERIYLADLHPPRSYSWAKHLREGLQSGRVLFVPLDVRQPIRHSELPSQCGAIFNFAAIHREPGHARQEYFDTNIPGAEHVCAYATASGARQMLFTSSIAPYGSSVEPKDEDTPPAPDTAYGESKLAAEKIHSAWQQENPARRLAILRPGVVFGPGEDANMARLVRSLAKGYFVYTGNREIRKAGIYAKELCCVMEYALEMQQTSAAPQLLWNVSYDPPPTLQEYVTAISAVLGRTRRPLSIPRDLLMAVAHTVGAVSDLLGVRQPLHPVRMRKLFRPTHIEPRRLREAGYRYHYTLQQAFADWRAEAPQDFLE